MKKVLYLLNNKFLSLTVEEEKFAIKELGRPTYHKNKKFKVVITTGHVTKNICFIASCGCDGLNQLFCFLCLLFTKVKTIPGKKLELLNWDVCLSKLKNMDNPFLTVMKPKS